MCGIAGIIAFDNLSLEDREIVELMTETLTHRGPDGSGFYFDRMAALGHRRLSIIDLEAGKQPMSNEDGSVWVVFNGEIYNYLDLKEWLEKKGHRFRTSSDTEVIVHLYEEVGEDFPVQLRGMFAIGLWDVARQRLVLVRDRVGKKPLYYSRFNKRVVFGSEIKALLEYPGIPREIDFEAAYDYFSLLYIPAPKSIFKSIRKVKPAHYLVIDSQGIREKSYWDLVFAVDSELSEERWCEEFLQAYSEAVRLRLRSDVPLGAFLSGGVDSSSVVALICGLNGNGLDTCSVGFDDREFDESAEAAALADRLETRHHEERVRPDALLALQTLAWHYDEPFADSSAVPTYYVSQAARRHVTVALSGDGGDENFAGYERYYRDCIESRVRSYFPEQCRGAVFGALGRWYPKLDWAPRIFRAQATFRALSFRAVEGYFYSVSGIKPEIQGHLLNREVVDSLNGYSTRTLFEDIYRRCTAGDHLSKLQYLDIKTYLVDDILVKVDRASMANSLEVRCPLLDHKLMELIARIPSSLKLKGKQTKYIFKKALRSLLPEEVLERRKRGFAVPLAKWFRNELKDSAGGLILCRDPLDILAVEGVEYLWRQHQSGMRDFSTPLWGIVMYRLWQEKYLKTKTQEIRGHLPRSVLA